MRRPKPKPKPVERITMRFPWQQFPERAKRWADYHAMPATAWMGRGDMLPEPPADWSYTPDWVAYRLRLAAGVPAPEPRATKPGDVEQSE